MFFGNQRAALLEFLRNLTPQVLILSAALVLWAKLVTSPNATLWEQAMQVLPLVMCVILLSASIFANMTRFLEAAVESSEQFNVAAERLSRSDDATRRKLGELVKIAWLHNKQALWQAVVVFFLVYGSLSPIVFSAISNAAALSRVLK